LLPNLILQAISSLFTSSWQAFSRPNRAVYTIKARLL